MLKIRAANPDVIILTTYARPATLIVKKAHELGMKMPIVLAVTGTANLKQLVENVGTKEAFKNFYVQDVINDTPTGPRSAEHTSELQSLMRSSYAVFCLKKQNKKQRTK